MRLHSRDHRINDMPIQIIELEATVQSTQNFTHVKFRGHASHCRDDVKSARGLLAGGTALRRSKTSVEGIDPAAVEKCGGRHRDAEIITRMINDRPIREPGGHTGWF
jgi:hypothetical protein